MFGAVNALFSGLAFAGIIYTIFLQKEELALQREELKANRDELARSARAQEASEKVLRVQAEALQQTAKLNSINFLIDVYNGELDSLYRHNIGTMGQGAQRAEARKQELIKRISTLNQELEKIFIDIAKE